MTKRPNRRDVLRAVPSAMFAGILALDRVVTVVEEQRQAESSTDVTPDNLQIHLIVLEEPDSTNPGGLEARERKMREVLEHLGRVAGIASLLSVERRTVRPDIWRRNAHSGEAETCLSEKWVNDYLTWRRTEAENTSGDQVIMAAWANDIRLEHDDTRTGVAYQDSDNPRFVLSKSATRRACMHEVLHLLGPNFQGLGHQRCFTTRRIFDGELVQAYAMDTIQRLVGDGCGLQMGANGLPEEYASRYTVMGDISVEFQSVMSSECQTDIPPFTTPELAFIDKRRRLETVLPAPGRYDLSYAVDGLAGVVIDLPEDHVLRQIIPEAERLCFGLAMPEQAYGDNKSCPPPDPHHPKHQSMVLPFVQWDGGRQSAVLDNASPWPWDIQERTAVYADEQLDLVAVAKRREYDGKWRHVVEFLPLSSEEGQRLLREARQRAEERNRLALGDE